MTIRSLVRVAAAAFAAALSLAAPASGQTIDPPPIFDPPVIQPIVRPCSEIASFTPSSARPGTDVDVHLRPPSGLAYLAHTITGVEFAGRAAAITVVNANHVRAKVPLGTVTGPIRVYCRTAFLNQSWSIVSAASFTPVNFGLSLSASPTTVLVGNSTTITATLSHPAPEPLALNIAAGVGLWAPVSPIIPAGQRVATFNVGAIAPTSGSTVVASGPNVNSASVTINVPAKGFMISQPADAEVHWGDSATYSVQVSGQNNFSGTVTLTAPNLPHGLTANPVNVNVPVNGTVNATFVVATAQEDTALGEESFTLRAESPNLAARTRAVDLRVLPDEGAFTGLAWQTSSSDCTYGNRTVEADVVGTNITFDGPDFVRTQAHTHLRYAWTPHCRGAVVMGTAVSANGGWPVSIFNVGFDNAIADAPGSRLNLGAAAWNHTHFKASVDGSYVIGVAQTANMHANLYEMLDLAQRPPMRSYTVAETLAARVAGDEIEGDPSGTSGTWTWALA